MSLPVFSELLQGQEGIKSIYTLHFQASIHDKQNLGMGAGVCVCGIHFSGSFLCSKTVLPSSSESLAYVLPLNLTQVILTLLMACTIVI